MSYDIVFDEHDHIYLVDGEEVPSVTTILKPLSDRGYGKINPSVLEYAARRGRAVHEALEIYDLGGELEVTPETAGYIKAYLEWSEIYKPSWKGVEQIVYADIDGYIGTLDRIGTLNDGHLAVVDIKTSTPTKEALVSVCMQTAAYASAYCQRHNVRGGWKTIRRYGLFLKADGTFRFQDCEDYEDKYGFHGGVMFSHLLANYHEITNILNTKAREK